MSRPRKILLVDDDPDIRDALANILHGEGYQVCCLANGVEALALLRTAARPDAIILDMMMPEMDGWEFSEELRAHPELGAPPVIYVSAAEGAAHHLRAEDTARFVVKPFDLPRLLSVLRDSLGA